MTLRTITSPYNPLTQALMRGYIGTALGQLYASMDSVLQTEVDRIIDASAEYVTKRFGHEPWTMHEIASATLASGTAVAEFAAAVRQVITIIEPQGEMRPSNHGRTGRELTGSIVQNV